LKPKQKTTKILKNTHIENSFKRTFAIPDSVNADKISADYNEGILKIHLPKKEEAKKKNDEKNQNFLNQKESFLSSLCFITRYS
jgi:HSP20 family molecular chaperone IbpA